MFCVHCGKPIVENASFCAFCGKPTQTPSPNQSPVTTEWEYTIYRQTWARGKGGRYNLLYGTTEYSVRLELWGGDESWVMKDIRELMDFGWQPISPPGPGSYRFIEDTDYSGSVKYQWLAVSAFLVEFRRPLTERTAEEKEILGIWQQAGDPNKGFWNKFGNVVFSQKLEVARAKITFRTDRTFTRTDCDGKEVEGGIFGSNGAKIGLIYKYSSEMDAFAVVRGNKLLITGESGREIEWERE